MVFNCRRSLLYYKQGVFTLKKTVKIRIDQKTWLFGKVAEADRGFATQHGASGSKYALFYRGAGSAVWTIETQQDDVYDMKIGYYAKTTSYASLTLGDQIILQTFEPVIGYGSARVPMRDAGMMQNLEDSESIDIVGTLEIPKGRHELRLDVSSCTDFRVYYIEMIPRKALPAIKAKEAQAAALRPSTAPIAKEGYGLFIHWTDRTKPRYGPMKPYEEAVNDFDVEMFADQMKELGASYVIFTAEHVSDWFCAPIKAWDKYHPGKTTKRDLIADLIPALKARGIKFFMYIHLPKMANFPEAYTNGFNYTNDDINNTAVLDALCDRLCEMLTEIGTRYGEDLCGYWLDGWQMIPLKYGIDPTGPVYMASKAGNKNRLTSFAFGVRCPEFTPWQDYSCGENRVIGALPVNGYYTSGTHKGYPYHTIIVMDDDWWHDQYDTPITDPQYTADQLAPFIIGCMENGGMVSVNTAVYQDGTVSDKARAVMRQTAKLVQNRG